MCLATVQSSRRAKRTESNLFGAAEDVFDLGALAIDTPGAVALLVALRLGMTGKRAFVFDLLTPLFVVMGLIGADGQWRSRRV